MKILRTSDITDSAQMPIKGGTLTFLQQANKEVFADLIKSLIGDTYSDANIYVLRGCKNTGTGSNYIIGGGAIFFDGEEYNVPSSSFSTTGTDVPVFSLLVNQFTTDADPVTFTDSSTKNVHDIRQIEVGAGASGSGLADYSAGIFMDFKIPAPLNATGAGVTGTYPNLDFAGPNGLFPILAASRVHVGDIPPSVMTKVITFTTALTTTSYIVNLTVISMGTTPADDIQVQCGVIDSTRTVNGFTIQFRETTAILQNIDIAYTVIGI